LNIVGVGAKFVCVKNTNTDPKINQEESILTLL